ncbi:uncharacterized protein [Haliotis cracherodii]|uniref:uncharacterized protein isoform X1 n=1 Tax=Haliotis cracherodii TaxID=6455 RepID=UPI0039EC2E3A
MKVAILILCLLPLALGEKRLLIDSILDTSEISKLVNTVLTKFGSDASEQQCETECLLLFKSDILDSACDFACKGIQGLIQRFHPNVAATTST